MVTQRRRSFQDFLEETRAERAARVFRTRGVQGLIEEGLIEPPRPPQEGGGVSLGEAYQNLLLATPTAAVTAAQQLIPGEQQLERLTREVGSFQAWLDMQWPTVRAPFLPRATGAMARQLGGPLAGPILRKVAEAVTPSQFGPKGAAEMFLQPDVLIGGVKPLTGVARGVVQAGKRPVAALGREVVPVARRVAAAEAGAARIPGGAAPEFQTVQGVDREIANLNRSIKLAERSGADISQLHQARIGLQEYRENLLQSTLSEPQVAELERLRGRVGEIRAELEVLGEVTPIKRPPKSAKHGLGLWSEARLRALAAHEGLDPYKADWWDSIDSVVVKEVRAKGAAIPGRTAQLRRELGVVQSDLRDLEAGRILPEAPLSPQVGGMQVGMGIGERAPQGQLLPEYVGAGERLPLASPEQLAARQARAAQVAAGQAEMPVTAAPIEPIQGVRSLPDMVKAQIARRDALAAAAKPAAQARTPQEIDEALSRFQVTREAQTLGDIPKPALETEAAFVARRLKEIRAEIKEMGFSPIPAQKQRILLQQEYRAAAAKPVAEPAPGLPIPGVRGVTETAVERGPGERLVAEPEVARARLEEARAAAAAGAPPIKPPIEPPVATGAVPPAEPVLPRPRTLADMNREAKGMRAMTPEQRAAVMDVAKPIEGDILYQARPFNEHAANLLGPDTDFMKALRGVPGVKQVFGAWNPAAMARDNPAAMIGLRQSIFQEIEKSRIRFATLRWWNDADEAFGFKRGGTLYGLKPTSGVWKATKVKAASPTVEKGKMFGTINDIIEHRERYALDDAQERVLALADNTLTQSVRDAQRAGVNVVELAEAYWPRSVIRGPKGERGFAGIRRRVSGVKGYTHQRVFADVDDLVKAGFEVETDPRRVFASRLEAGIDTIAQANARKQIAGLPGVEKPLERMARRFPEVLESARQARSLRDESKVIVRKAGTKATPEEVMTLRQAEADYITSMREVFAKKIEAGTPGYYELRLPSGRIAPQELVEEVGKFIDLPELRQAGLGGAAQLTQEVSQLLRATLTNVDLAAGYIQGQSLFYRNNVAWWKAQGASVVSLVDDPTAWVAKNYDLIDEGVRAGAIVAPTEFLFAKQGIASIPLRVPYAGPALGSFNRAFEWFITAGQTELYKAARSGAFKSAGMDELVSLGSAIRKEVGTESYAILGIRPNQRTMEALSLFAARFFRANVGLLGQSFTRGAGGAEARKALGTLIAGGTAITIGINWVQNKKLPNMTDPYAPDWMQFKIGNTYFSAFGPMYGYFRTLARMGVALGEGDPLKAATAAKQFLQSKESLPLRAIDIGGQLVYYGSANVYGTKIEKEWASIAKGILSEFVIPISIQEIPSGIAEGRPEAALEFGGLTGRAVRVASEWTNDLKAYRDLPSNPREAEAKGMPSRDAYRKANPEVDAKLFIVGETTSLKTFRAKSIAVQLMQENGIAVKDIKGLEPQKYEKPMDERVKLRRYFERALGSPVTQADTPQWTRAEMQAWVSVPGR